MWAGHSVTGTCGTAPRPGMRGSDVSMDMLILMLVREWQAHDRRLGAHLTVKKGTERIDRKPQTSSAEQQCGVSKPRHMARSN